MLLFAITVACLLLLSCQEFSAGARVKDFIPGTYASTWTGPYSKTSDTISITTIQKEGSEVYLVTRRTKLEYIGSTVARPPEYKIVHWTATWQESSRTILVHNNGRLLSFDPAADELKMGVITYKKL